MKVSKQSVAKTCIWLTVVAVTLNFVSQTANGILHVPHDALTRTRPITRSTKHLGDAGDRIEHALFNLFESRRNANSQGVPMCLLVGRMVEDLGEIEKLFSASCAQASKFRLLRARLIQVMFGCRHFIVFTNPNCNMNHTSELLFNPQLYDDRHALEAVLFEATQEAACSVRDLASQLADLRSKHCALHDDPTPWFSGSCEMQEAAEFYARYLFGETSSETIGDITAVLWKKHRLVQSTMFAVSYITEMVHEYARFRMQAKRISSVPVDKVMIVAHADDEAIFGGRQLLESTGWLVVCVGCNEVFYDPEITRLARRDEFLDAMNIASACSVMLGHRNGYSFKEDEFASVACDVFSILDSLGPSLEKIVTHDAGLYGGDYEHPLHVVVRDAVFQAASWGEGMTDKLHVFARADEKMSSDLLLQKLDLLKPYIDGTQRAAVDERINDTIPFEGTVHISARSIRFIRNVSHAICSSQWNGHTLTSFKTRMRG